MEIAYLSWGETGHRVTVARADGSNRRSISEARLLALPPMVTRCPSRASRGLARWWHPTDRRDPRSVRQRAPMTSFAIPDVPGARSGRFRELATARSSLSIERSNTMRSIQRALRFISDRPGTLVVASVPASTLAATGKPDVVHEQFAYHRGRPRRRQHLRRSCRFRVLDRRVVHERRHGRRRVPPSDRFPRNVHSDVPRHLEGRLGGVDPERDERPGHRRAGRSPCPRSPIRSRVRSGSTSGPRSWSVETAPSTWITTTSMSRVVPRRRWGSPN